MMLSISVKQLEVIQQNEEIENKINKQKIFKFKDMKKFRS